MGELALCDKRAAYHFCPEGNIAAKEAIFDAYDGQVDDKLCTFFVFEAKYEAIKSACRFTMAKPTNQGFLLSGTRAVFVGAKTHQGTMKCDNQVTTNFQVEGITEVDVPEGCTADTPYFTVTGSSEPDSKNVERSFNWPTAMMPLWSDIDLDLLDAIEVEGVYTAPLQTDELRLFLAETQTHAAAYYSRFALWGVLAVLALTTMLAFYWTWHHKRRLQRKMRALLVHGVDKLLDAAAAQGRQQDADRLRALLPRGVGLAAPARLDAPPQEDDVDHAA